MESVPGGANYWDLGHLEGHASLFYFFDCDEGAEERRLLLPIPEDTMTELESLLGDGNATITVGKDLKVSENFKTAGSSCFVKLTCNQDLATVLAAREIATALAMGFVEQGFEQAQYTMDRICGKDVDPPAPLVIDIGTAEADPEPDRKQPKKSSSKRPAPKGRPSFKR